ncbi:ER membrane protein complex subunit 10-like [Halichondria panicea]|uniref:ER membrane protein complex subunit 10-like n=1 Tax=Halichondria panicea TaxID=6063 RepID=UPI00312B8680
MTRSSKVFCLVVLLLALIARDLYAKKPPKQGKRVKEDAAASFDDEDSFIDDSSITVDIEHSIGSADAFVKRGTAYVRGLRSSRSMVTFQQDSLSQTQLQHLKSAARSGGVYFLRARASFTEGLAEEPHHPGHVTTVISACSLYNSRLSDWITISGDGQGNIIGLTVTTPVHTMGLDCSFDFTLPHHFNTTITLDNGAPGPMPNTQAFHEKKEKEEQQKKDGTDNRSFLQKYWMYILIGFVVFSIMNGLGGGGGQ